MPEVPTLTESEWLIMTRLWNKYPMTAMDIVDTPVNGKKLPVATVRTLLRRLVARNVVGYTVDEKNTILYHYYPMVCERDCVQKENKRFLELYYQSNAGKLFAAFMDNAELSDEEIERLKQRLDDMKEKNK